MHLFPLLSPFLLSVCFLCHRLICLPRCLNPTLPTAALTPSFLPLLVVEILSDIIQNPTLGAQEIERERNVILREMEVRAQRQATFIYL